MLNDDLASEYESRAASLRHIALTMRDEDERAELLGIAAGYEAEAKRLREAVTPT